MYFVLVNIDGGVAELV